MAVKFADVVEELRERFPELRAVPVYVGSSVCHFYGPCFLFEPGAELAERLHVFYGQLFEEADSTPAMGVLRQQFEGVMDILSAVQPGVHLPEDMDWVQEAVEMAAQLLAEIGLDPGEASLVSGQLEAIASRIRAAGLEPTEEVVAEFIVLHETGHYFDYLKTGDPEVWRFRVNLAVVDLLCDDGDLAAGYRQMEHEVRADEFALAKLKELYRPRRSLLGAVLRFVGKGGDK